jgi:hypothetical protein
VGLLGWGWGGWSYASSYEQELQRDASGGLRWSVEGGWRGEVRENQQVEGDPFRASVWAEEERNVRLDGEVEWWY